MAAMTSRLAIAVVAVASGPGSASAKPLTATGVFQHATPMVQAIALCLVVAMVAAVAVCVLKLMRGPAAAGGSAFLSGLRLGGPIAGALGAGYGVLNMCIGLSNVSPSPSIQVLAPGWAEAMMLLVLGFLTGVVAVVANWAVESRIDRAVLRS